MTLKKAFTCLTGCCLTVMLALGSVGSVATAFSIPVSGFVFPAAMCSLAAALSLFFCTGPRLRWLPVPVFLLLGAVFWHFGDLEISAERILYHISLDFDRVYDCGVIRWTCSVPNQASPISGLCALSMIASLAAAGCIFRKIPILYSSVLLLSAPLLCIASVDPIPEKLWLFLLLTGYLLLLMTDLARQRRSPHWHTLTGLLAIPAALAVLLLLNIPQRELPPKDRIQALADRLSEQLTGSSNIQSTRPVVGSLDSDQVDLSQIGDLTTSRLIVMDLSGSASGILYLRGQALDQYDGLNWSSSGQDSGLYWPGEDVLREAGRLSIHTRRLFPAIYVPYYAENTVPDVSGIRLGNTSGLTDYSYDLLALTSNPAVAPVPAAPDTPCLQLPVTTRLWAENLLKDILPAEVNDPRYIARLISAYVADSAEYSLVVNTIPAMGTDFVRWFLETQDTGYCVHFASSAVVLLRAAGIPARYATGYMVEKTGDTAIVRAEDAHAWAEYWIDGIGWMVLEATPAAAQPQRPAETTASTAPSASGTRPTASTAASTGSTIASNPQQPSQPTDREPQVSQHAPGYAAIFEWLLFIVLPLSALEIQRRLRLTHRQRRLRRKAPNARALALWQEAAMLAKLLGERPPQTLHAAAQKAKFSQHTLTPEELAPFGAYIRACRTKLGKKTWYLRLVHRYLFAAY